MENEFRTILVKDIDDTCIGKSVVISGWVENIRDHGGVLFLDLRDTSGIIQTVSNDDSLFKGLAKESVVRLKGIIRKRNEETINENIDTGTIELLVDTLEVLSPSLHEMPFDIKNSKSVSEDKRL